MVGGSWVGLDVHARSVFVGVLDARSCELRTLRVPVRVAYEAGPTG